MGDDEVDQPEAKKPAAEESAQYFMFGGGLLAAGVVAAVSGYLLIGLGVGLVGLFVLVAAVVTGLMSR